MFGMDKAKAECTPVAAHLKSSKDTAREKVDPSMYCSIIGSLLYLTASRLNIAFVVEVCAGYQIDSRKFHFYSAKRILKYITGTVDYGLWYNFDTTVILIGYCDADWVGCSDDHKITS